MAPRAAQRVSVRENPLFTIHRATDVTSLNPGMLLAAAVHAQTVQNNIKGTRAFLYSTALQSFWCVRAEQLTWTPKCYARSLHLVSSPCTASWRDDVTVVVGSEASHGAGRVPGRRGSGKDGADRVLPARPLRAAARAHRGGAARARVRPGRRRAPASGNPGPEWQLRVPGAWSRFVGGGAAPARWDPRDQGRHIRRHHRGGGQNGPGETRRAENARATRAMEEE